jgi:hypothetical protein
MPYAKMNDEKTIIKAIEESEFIGNLKDTNKIIDVVAKWRMYIGMPKQDITEELTVISSFIFMTYKHLTLKEIELAYHLSAIKVLDDVEFHGYFSPMYVGKVIDAYLYYRKKNLADAIRRKEKHEWELADKKNTPSPEKQAEDWKEMVEGFYKKYQEMGEIEDVFNLCYDYFRNKNKLLKISKEILDEALLYGADKAQKRKQNANPFLKFNLEQEQTDAEREKQRWAKNYCVQKFFSTIKDINLLLETIKPEHFIEENS